MHDSGRSCVWKCPRKSYGALVLEPSEQGMECELMRAEGGNVDRTGHCESFGSYSE